MPRQPRPWYRAARDSWYVKIGGKQYLLVRGKASRAAATAAFARLVVSLGREATAAPGPPLTVAEACEVWLDHAQAVRTAGGYTSARSHLQVVVDELGSRTLTSLTAPELERIGERRKVRPETRRNYIRTLRTAWRHALRCRLTEVPWPDGVRLPAATARAVTLSADDRRRLREGADPDLRDLLDVLAATGCRPHVARELEARHIDWQAGIATLASKGRPYVLVIPTTLRPLLERLAKLYPDGPILRAEGKPWSSDLAVKRFARLAHRLDIAGASLYAYRHSYATDALEAGMSPALVAGLLNHQDLTMLSRHYSHMSERRDTLRRAAEEAALAASSAPSRDTTPTSRRRRSAEPAARETPKARPPRSRGGASSG